MTAELKDEGILLVVSGPSGAGKGTICSAVRKIYPDLEYSISMTTRAPRNGEQEGVSYFFVQMMSLRHLLKKMRFLNMPMYITIIMELQKICAR